MRRLEQRLVGDVTTNVVVALIADDDDDDDDIYMVYF